MTDEEIKQIFDKLFHKYFVEKDYFEFGEERHIPEIQEKWNAKLFKMVNRVRNHLLGVEEYLNALDLIRTGQIFTRSFLHLVDDAPKAGGVAGMVEFYLNLRESK